MVVAKTAETARYAASLLVIDYAVDTPAADLDTQCAEGTLYKPTNVWGEPTDDARGDPATVFGTAAVEVQAVYSTALQHHVAMEPHATVAAWDGDRLTVWESTTWVYGVRKTVATWFDLNPDNVRVRQQVVGGSFGSKGPTWPHVAIAVAAAKHVGRAVKLVLPREQTFTSNGYRPRIRHAIRLAADTDGRLTAMTYDAVAETSVFDDRVVAPVTTTPPRVYACPNVATTYRLARLNRSGPFTFRRPGETPGLFALECAMDELAHAAGIDPLELRRRNHADTDPHAKQPWSSKHLLDCYAAAADRFGWEARDPMPGVRHDGPDLVGTGLATMMYDARSSPCVVEMHLAADGRLTVRTATCDQGAGSRTALSQIAADAAGVDVGAVRFQLGDTDLPMAPIQAASQTTASVGAAIVAAGRSLRREVARRVVADADSPLHGANADAVEMTDGRLRVAGEPSRVEPLPAFLRRCGPETIRAEGKAEKIDATEGVSRFSFGVHMAEVRVDAVTRRARVSRYVAAFAAGRIINPLLAHSQLIGGIVWGIGQALMEETYVDPTTRRLVNENLAEYLVPTNADVPGGIDAFFVPEEDDWQVNPLGVKGVGEIGTIGSAAAIANAVFHATGRRVRDLPITPDKLL